MADAIDTAQRTTSIIRLTSPEFVDQFAGDINGEVAAMILVHARETRDFTRQARAAEERNLVAQEDQQVQKMHDQADAIRWAGRLQGALTIVGGVCQFEAGLTTLNATPMTDGKLTHIDDGEVMKWKGGGDGLQGAGTLFGAEEKGHAQDLEAEGTAAAHRAEAAKRRLDDLRDEEKNAIDQAHTAIDDYRELTRTKTDTDRATLSFRA